MNDSNVFFQSTEDFQLANRTYFKFMFVRHPMDRMLSCYMDKMVESAHNSLPPFRSYVKSRARSIIANRLRLVQPSGNASTRRTVRTAGGRSARDASVLRRKRRISNDEDETHRFIGRKLNADDANDGTQPSVAKSAFEKDNVTRAGEIPTFEEFLEFVLDTDLQGKQRHSSIGFPRSVAFPSHTVTSYWTALFYWTPIKE